MIVTFKGFDGETLIGYVTSKPETGLVKICTKPGEYYLMGVSEIEEVK